MSIKIFDPHVHLFDVSEGQYAWLKTLSAEDQGTIARSFSFNDIAFTGELELAGIVHIEAGFDNQQPWREIQNIEEELGRYNQTANIPLQCKTAGYADLTTAPKQFASKVDKQKGFDSCVAIRHILDENAIKVLEHKHTLKNLRYLAQCQIRFELQFQLSETVAGEFLIAILKSIPELNVILNHAGLPPLQNISGQKLLPVDPALDKWQQNIESLGLMPNVTIKCSGWEMLQRDYHQYQLIWSMEHIAKCFSEDKIMFASNFPLVLFSREYAHYWQSMIEVGRCCHLDINKVCFENAKRIYGA